VLGRYTTGASRNRSPLFADELCELAYLDSNQD
jgi:hypothetical protein